MRKVIIVSAYTYRPDEDSDPEILNYGTFPYKGLREAGDAYFHASDYFVSIVRRHNFPSNTLEGLLKAATWEYPGPGQNIKSACVEVRKEEEDGRVTVIRREEIPALLLELTIKNAISEVNVRHRTRTYTNSDKVH